MNRDNFDGSMYDAESDMQMLGFRMYDNETGRFTTPDLLWSAFPAQTPYHYAYNSPLTYRDPTGLAPEKEKEGEELMGWVDCTPLQPGYEIQNSKLSDDFDPYLRSLFEYDFAEAQRLAGGGGVMGFGSKQKSFVNFLQYAGDSKGRSSSSGGVYSGNKDPFGLIKQFGGKIHDMFETAKITKMEHGGIFYKNLSGEIKCRTTIGIRETSMGDNLAILAMKIMREEGIGRGHIFGNIHTHQVSSGPFSFKDMYSISQFCGLIAPTGYLSYLDNGDVSYVVGENGIYGFEITNADGFSDNFWDEFGYPSGDPKSTIKIIMPNYPNSNTNILKLNEIFGKYGNSFYIKRSKK